MKPEEYIKNTSVTDHTDEQALVMASRCKDKARLLHYVLGVGTEAGELQDALKRCIAYGKELDSTNVKEECSDVLWYIARILDHFNWSFEEVMETNINKLKARYGDKFSEHAALNRDLETERKVLESK